MDDDTRVMAYRYLISDRNQWVSDGYWSMVDAHANNPSMFCLIPLPTVSFMNQSKRRLLTFIQSSLPDFYKSIGIIKSDPGLLLQAQMALNITSTFRQWKDTYVFNEADMIRIINKRNNANGAIQETGGSMPLGSVQQPSESDISQDMRSLLGGGTNEFPIGVDNDDNVPMGRPPAFGSNMPLDRHNNPDVLNYTKLLEGARDGTQDRNTALDNINDKDDQIGLFQLIGPPITSI